MSKRTSKAISKSDEPVQPTMPVGNSKRLEVAIDPALHDGAKIRKFADHARSPATRAAISAMPITKSLMGEVDLTQTLASLNASIAAVQSGDLGEADRMLVAQADTLDALFHQLVARSSANSTAGFLQASETYMRLALKAQSQARATWESLSKIKNPVGSTFVRQANIANGPQQVNNHGDAETNTRDSTPGRVRELESQPNELSGVSGHAVDSGATGAAVGGDTPLGTMAEGHRAED